MFSRTNICNSTAKDAVAPYELSILNDSSVECCEEGFGPLRLYYSVFDQCRSLIPSAVPVGQCCLQLCFRLYLMFYHLFYFQFHSLAGLETQLHATTHLCIASSEHRQSLWLPSKDPIWRGLSWAGNGEESGREWSCPAPTSCVWWQGWPAKETNPAPQKWGKSPWPYILEQSKLSPPVQGSRTLCIFFLDEITPITLLIYGSLFLTWITTALWSLRYWLSDLEKGNTNTTMIMKWKLCQKEQPWTSVLSKILNLRSTINRAIAFMSQKHEGRTK